MPRRNRFSPDRHCLPSVCPFAPLESSVAACHGFRSKSLALRCWCACRRRAVPGRTWTGRSRCWLPVRFPSKRTPMSCACLGGELRLISLPETLQGGLPCASYAIQCTKSASRRRSKCWITTTLIIDLIAGSACDLMI